jgi:hypothetical protein
VIKLTVVGVEGRLVYETLILPDGEIVDYNTRFSGISARDLKKAQAKTLREVQVSGSLHFIIEKGVTPCFITPIVCFYRMMSWDL